MELAQDGALNTTGVEAQMNIEMEEQTVERAVRSRFNL
jgi:hypothetical protein